MLGLWIQRRGVPGEKGEGKFAESGGGLESGGFLEGALDSSVGGVRLGGGRGFMKERIDFWALPPRRFPWRRMGMSLGIPRAERGPEVEERGLVAHVRKKVSSGSPECWETREWSSRQVKSRILGLSGREVSSRSSIQTGFAALGSMKSFKVVWSSSSSVSSMEKAEVSSRGLGDGSDEVGTGGEAVVPSGIEWGRGILRYMSDSMMSERQQS